MDFVMSPADLEKIAGAAMRIDPNPLKLAGRAVGLGDAEMAAGVPTWAWVVLALGAGAVVGIKYGPGIREKLPF
jgi:hypothetical protein